MTKSSTHDRAYTAPQALDSSLGRVSYIDRGSGPVLLFVHSGLWSFIFESVIDRLSDRYRCITLDFPGFGRSRSTDADLGAREQSSVLEEFVERLDLRSVTLIAHDLGGPVGIAAAGRMPDRFAGIVLANTFVWTPDTPGLRLMLRVMGSRPITAFGATTNVIPRLSSTRFGVGRHLDDAGRRTFLEPFDDSDVRRRFHLTMRSVVRDPELTNEAHAAAIGPLNGLPVLSVFGERNDPFGFQRRHAATFPDHEGRVVEGGNHFPMCDDPDSFSAWLDDWFHRKVMPAEAE